jgi:hypothetical protein
MLEVGSATIEVPMSASAQTEVGISPYHRVKY